MAFSMTNSRVIGLQATSTGFKSSTKPSDQLAGHGRSCVSGILKQLFFGKYASFSNSLAYIAYVEGNAVIVFFNAVRLVCEKSRECLYL